MAGPKARTHRAAALHRRAAATAAVAAMLLDETRPAPADQQRQHAVAERLRAAAAVLAPGWAGASLESMAPDAPAGDGPPPFVRVGTAVPLDEARFPVVVPLFGTGHLTVDADARDPRVAGLLRAVLLRLLAAAPAGALLVRAVDATSTATTTSAASSASTVSTTNSRDTANTRDMVRTTSPAKAANTPDTASAVLSPFGALADAGLLPPPVSDVAGLRAVLTEAEQWVTPGPEGRRRHDRSLLLVVAALPGAAGVGDLARLEALAEAGPAAGLHLLVAGWPTAGRAPLPRATAVAIRTAYALVGDPPGTSFAGPDASPGGLNSPVRVEEEPPPGLVEAVCRRLAAQVEAGSRLALSDLLPTDEEGRWRARSVEGLSTRVGDSGGRPVSLGFTELTPHWLVSGRSRGCRSTFLTTALLGLATRYGPDELALYLVDLAEGESFVEFLQTERDRSWVPHVRAAAMAADREYVLDLFDQLTAEVHRRTEAALRTGGQRFAELREHRTLPRVVCVVDGLPLLFAERDRLAVDVGARLDALARSGRAYGVHLVLAGEADLGLGSRADSGRDSVLGQFPVRVALPGGGAILEPTNDAAAGLPVGSAVVNTAGGLGGPRGAIRGHERMVRFPDPQDDPGVVERLRHGLWSARSEDAVPPVVFAGYAQPSLRNDPRYRSACAGRESSPAALLGRAVDVARTSVAVPFGPAAGRNLAVLGPRPVAARLLATAVRGTAAHHPPGTARFVVAVLDDESRPLAEALAGELAQRHPVEVVDGPGLLAALGAGEPGYLVAFGLDVPVPELSPARLRVFLREGPPTGRHLLGWWRTVPSFAALLEPEETVDKLAAVVAAGVPGAQLSPVFGRPVEWRPRPDRALLWDGPDERGLLLVPFAGEESS